MQRFHTPRSLVRIQQELPKNNMTKPEIYIDMDGVVADFDGAYKRQLKPDLLYPQSRPGFFLTLQLIPGALEAVTYLLASDKCDTFFLSAPSNKNIHSYTEKAQYIERYFGHSSLDRLILASRKDKLLKSGVTQYLIDDYNYHRNGQSKWEEAGKLIHFGTDKFPNWFAVLRFLHEQAI